MGGSDWASNAGHSGQPPIHWACACGSRHCKTLLSHHDAFLRRSVGWGQMHICTHDSLIVKVTRWLWCSRNQGEPQPLSQRRGIARWDEKLALVRRDDLHLGERGGSRRAECIDVLIEHGADVSSIARLGGCVHSNGAYVVEISWLRISQQNGRHSRDVVLVARNAKGSHVYSP